MPVSQLIGIVRNHNSAYFLWYMNRDRLHAKLHRAGDAYVKILGQSMGTVKLIYRVFISVSDMHDGRGFPRTLTEPTDNDVGLIGIGGIQIITHCIWYMN